METYEMGVGLIQLINKFLEESVESSDVSGIIASSYILGVLSVMSGNSSQDSKNVFFESYNNLLIRNNMEYLMEEGGEKLGKYLTKNIKKDQKVTYN